MKRAPIGAVCAALLALVCVSCEDSSPDDRIVIGAAASTGDVLSAAVEAWNARDPRQARVSFAASSTIARQIERGAPIDVFVSAHARWIKSVPTGAPRAALARGQLVLVAARGGGPLPHDIRAGESLPASLVGKRWATGDPEHVPAGMYAEEALRALGWWDALAPSLLPATDVRAGLRLLEAGEVDFAICYATDCAGPGADAALAGWVVLPFAAELHGPIEILGTVVGAGNRASKRAAGDFLRWLSGEEGRALFAAHGFLPGGGR